MPPLARSTKLNNRSDAAQPSIAPAESGVDPAIAKTQVLPTRAVKKFNALPLLLGIMLLTGGGALLAYSLSLSFRGWVDRLLGSALVPSPTPSPISTAIASPLTAPSPPLQIGSFLHINPVTPPPDAQAAMVVLSEPRNLQPPLVDTSLVPIGSIVQVLGVRATNPQERWVQLKVCSLPGVVMQSSFPKGLIAPQALAPFEPVRLLANPTISVPSIAPSPIPATSTGAEPGLEPTPSINPSALPTPEILPLGEVAWVQEAEVIRWASLKAPLTLKEQGVCAASPAPINSEELSFLYPGLHQSF